MMISPKALLQQQYRQTPMGKFVTIRNRARKRGIEWQLSFQEWYQVWIDSGHWEDRGRTKDSYNMCRYKDTGPYSVTNVYIASHLQNLKDSIANGCMAFPRTVSYRKGKRYIPLEVQREKKRQWERNQRHKVEDVYENLAEEDL